jgi:hypothetical protein
VVGVNDAIWRQQEDQITAAQTAQSSEADEYDDSVYGDANLMMMLKKKSASV